MSPHFRSTTLHPQASFVLATMLAVLSALGAAEALGYDYGYWAAMTACLVMQPSRGIFLERVAARFVGTVAGAAVGYVLLRELSSNPWLLAVAFCCWTAACCATAMLFRFQRSYAVQLAGFTACIVAAAGLAEPAIRETVALSRIACMLIGVGCALMVGLALIESNAPWPLLGRMRGVSDQASALAGAELHGVRTDSFAFTEFLVEVGRLDIDCDRHAAGSPMRSVSVRWARQLLQAAVALIAESRAAAKNPDPLDKHDFALAGLGPKQAMATALEGAASACDGKARPPLFSVRDLASSAIVAARAFLCLFATSAAWLASGEHHGSALIASAAIFMTLFSGQDDPVAATTTALKGSIVGAIAAIVYRLVVQPHVGTLATLLVSLAPFVAAGAWAMARPRTAKAGIDCTLTFLLIAQPAILVGKGIEDAAARAVATLLGLGISILAYRYVLPASPARRMTALYGRMQADLGAIRKMGASRGSRRIFRRMLTRSVTIGALAAAQREVVPPDLLDLLADAAGVVESTGNA